MTTKEAMTELGRIGGSVKSARKAAASRENGKLGGKKKSSPAAPPIISAAPTIPAPVRPLLIAAKPKLEVE